MIIDSDSWTDASGKAWHKMPPIKRSRLTRSFLAIAILLQVIFIVVILGDYLPSGIIESQRAFYFLAIMVFTASNLWSSGSPFRYSQAPFWSKLQLAHVKISLPDEFEKSIYAQSNVLASRLVLLGVIAIFCWLKQT